MPDQLDTPDPDVARLMHEDFIRDDWAERLYAHAGLNADDAVGPTRQQVEAFESDRLDRLTALCAAERDGLASGEVQA